MSGREDIAYILAVSFFIFFSKRGKSKAMRKLMSKEGSKAFLMKHYLSWFLFQ